MKNDKVQRIFDRALAIRRLQEANPGMDVLPISGTDIVLVCTHIEKLKGSGEGGPLPKERPHKQRLEPEVPASTGIPKSRREQNSEGEPEGGPEI